MRSALRSAARPVLFAVLVLLPSAGSSALGGTPAREGPTVPPQPPPIGIDQIKEIAPPEGWEKCPKCGRFHQPGYICCCPICGSCHPKDLKCRAEKTAPLREALCPVCAKRFNGPLPFRRNAEAGCDHDFCTHSVGQSVVDSTVWMCPRCGYANFCPTKDPRGNEVAGEFNKPLDARAAKAVREGLEPLFKKRVGEMAGRHAAVFEELDQTDIPDWLKFEMALKSAEFRGAPAFERAKFALEGSYSCRRALLSPVSMPAIGRVILAGERAIEVRGGVARNPRTVVKAVSDILAEASAASDKDRDKKDPAAAPKLSPGEAWYLRLRLAGAYDRLGEKQLALDNLDAAEKVIKDLKMEPAEMKPFLALVADHRKFIEREAEFRAAAVAALRQALLTDNAYPGVTAVPAVYLLGELYRREGDCVRAKTWLTLAGKLAVKDPVLAGWADEAMGLPGMKSAEPDDAEEAAALAFVEKLTGRKPEFEVRKPDPEKTAGPAAAAPRSCAEIGRASCRERV
mgnify:FL=1